MGRALGGRELKLTIVGGGSHQWVPTLVRDIVNTPCLDGAALTLLDIDPSRLPKMARYAEHVAAARGVDLRVTTTGDQRAALRGADFVIVNISTGGLESMGIDLAVAARHGCPVPIGDTVSVAGISRALRNVPVLLGIARAMERECPDAWLLNLSNPLTALTRVVTKETSIRAVGLCHEVTNACFFLSQVLDCGMFDVRPTIAGVNHLPIVTRLDLADGRDGMAVLREVLGDDDLLSEPLPFLDAITDDQPVTTGGSLRHPLGPGHKWTKRSVVDHYSVGFELLERFGAFPAAATDHTVEFFPGFVTEASGWGKRWHVEMVTIAEREGREVRYIAELDRLLADPDVSPHRSMEMVAPVIEALVTGTPVVLPLNIPNHGQCPDAPLDAVVEAYCVVDASGIRGRDVATLPPALAESVRRVATSQELTVAAAVTGDRDLLLSALLADPIAGRLDWDELVATRDDIVDSTARWLPQFAR